jgi:hypothetical protein
MTGAVLPNAAVSLTASPDAIVLTTVADAAGTFRFDGVPPGSYTVRVTYEGFEPGTVRLTVGTRVPPPIRIVLQIAGLKQEITISNQTSEVSARAAANSDAVSVDRDTLESLPVFDQDLVATASRFLDAGALGNGGLTIVVDGMEVSALRVSASAIQQITINQDPYSAEYARPGRGRIQILTKPGSSQYRGEFNTVGRNAALDARNAFSTTKPSERKRIFEGTYGGPLVRSGKTAFLVSGHDQLENQQAFVVAAGLSGTIRESIPQQDRRSLLAGSLTYQRNESTTMSLRTSYEYESERNRGVGGTTLATAATNTEQSEQQATYTQQTIVDSNLLRNFRC